MLDFRYEQYLSDHPDALIKKLGNSVHNILYTEFSKMLFSPLSPNDSKNLSNDFIDYVVSLVPNTGEKKTEQARSLFTDNIGEFDDDFLERCLSEYQRLLNLPNLKKYFENNIFIDLDQLVNTDFRKMVVTKYQQIIGDYRNSHPSENLNLGRLLEIKTNFELSHYLDDNNAMPFYEKYYWPLFRDTQVNSTQESYPQSLYEQVHRGDDSDEKIAEMLNKIDSYNLCNVNVFDSYVVSFSHFHPEKLVGVLMDKPDMVSLANEILTKIDDDKSNRVKFILNDLENINQPIWSLLLKRIYRQNHPEITDDKILEQKLDRKSVV